ncbi:hypothetical protein BDW62DRAFT_103184 [Aspergillus aurantiobrunneus]
MFYYYLLNVHFVLGFSAVLRWGWPRHKLYVSSRGCTNMQHCLSLRRHLDVSTKLDSHREAPNACRRSIRTRW